MAPDPLAGALCREGGADPHWWDVDATPDGRVIAAWVCAGCPAQAACAERCVALGPVASGTWAGQWRPWTDSARDETAVEFEALFGRMYTTERIIDTRQLSLLDLMEAN